METGTNLDVVGLGFRGDDVVSYKEVLHKDSKISILVFHDRYLASTGYMLYPMYRILNNRGVKIRVGRTDAYNQNYSSTNKKLAFLYISSEGLGGGWGGISRNPYQKRNLA